MSYEWVGVVATATVGLAGIAATLLLARANRADQVRLLRLQHEEERKAALLDTKRKSYGELSANINVVMLCVVHAEADLQEIQSCVHALMRSIGEVELLASEPVRQVLQQVAARILKILGEAIIGENQSEMYASIQHQHFILRRLMANDLGISSWSSIDEQKDVINTLRYTETVSALRERMTGSSVPKPDGETGGNATVE
jgi:hypothetical protein